MSPAIGQPFESYLRPVCAPPETLSGGGTDSPQHWYTHLLRVSSPYTHQLTGEASCPIVKIRELASLCTSWNIIWWRDR
ncbi:hypothetical protein RRG08_015658 [Elysia crispata]|uniref:Uncharacterized protein n=1 Tax=Elysia crispata TaxID=231223 RepID=A0AAE1CU21_9GAST|nr:hypothetical protein RRG08_015658 [Elysia crispata]